MSHLPADFHRRLECGTALPSAPSGEPATPRICRVIAKGGKCTRGLHENPSPDHLLAWEFDGDIVQWLAPIGSATTAPAPLPAEWRKAVQEAYGWLWHVNQEPMAPIPMWEPEKAAYQARKCLRELLTTAERGEAINAIAAHIDKIAAGSGAAPLLSNGLTEAETNATASVAGLTPQAAPALAGLAVQTDPQSVRKALMSLARRDVITDADRIVIGAAIGHIGAAQQGAVVSLAGLSDARIDEIADAHEDQAGRIRVDAVFPFARAIEAELKHAAPQAAPAPLPLGGHTAADCSAAFEWLRAEAVKPGADPRAGVALDAWHAAASGVIPQAAPAPQAATTAPAPLPADPMDWPLPCDVKVGHGTMRKGVALRTLVTRMKVLYRMATGEDADEVAGRTLQQRKAMAAPLLSNGLTRDETAATASVAGLVDWTKPTTVQQRMSDAVTLLCAGKRPPDDMVAGWLDRDAEDGRLQEFAIEHGPAWCQGIALLDAAQAMVDQPTEGVAHEHAEPQAARATPPAAHKEQP